MKVSGRRQAEEEGQPGDNARVLVPGPPSEIKIRAATQDF